MCCTIELSHVTNTIVSCIEARHHATGALVHVLGYQNKATSNMPNAMLIPFPTRVAMGPANVVDTRKCPTILMDYKDAISPPMPMCFGDDSSRGVSVFDAGSYTIVLAANAGEIPAALMQVPSNKRPAINQALFDRYAELYPANDWQIALCCWDGAIDAEPMMWWYEPNDPTRLFLPGLDAHDGKPPSSGPVDVDHVLVVGSNIRKVPTAQPIYFGSSISSDVSPFIASRVNGAEFTNMQLPNGDWWFNVAGFDRLNEYSCDNEHLFNRVTPTH